MTPTDRNVEHMTGNEGVKKGERFEPAEENRREIDIEDQGQAIDAEEEVNPDVAPVDGKDIDPGPEGVGAQEATQKSGRAPTKILDEDADSADE
ncbi:hypothetical protein [Halobellus ruber]|uniref:Uncharacterized protein n=1 Tax=Halobellus ruber TaxID=2761102 RepID=A0A7J9SKI6_9EURY|nr:hypothetical protein [Halobellus ruber]MBB6647470.1 hypothetical protein [Halobellus ruber]